MQSAGLRVNVPVHSYHPFKVYRDLFEDLGAMNKCIAIVNASKQEAGDP